MAAARAPRRRHARTTARRSPGPPPARGSARPSPTRRGSPTSGSPALVRGRSGGVPARRLRGGRAAGIEAIACGTPVVASAVGALPEIVGAGRDPRRAARLRTGSPSALDDDLGRRRRPRRRWPRRPGSGPPASRGPGPTSRRETRAVYADVGRSDAGRLNCAADRSVGGAVARARDPAAAAGRPALIVTFDPVWQDLDERLADGQRDLLAVGVEELGRLRSGVFFHVPLIVGPVGRDPGRARCRRRRPRGGACWMPSLSGPNCISMTTTFFGATRSPVARVGLLRLAGHASAGSVGLAVVAVA